MDNNLSILIVKMRLEARLSKKSGVVRVAEPDPCKKSMKREPWNESRRQWRQVRRRDVIAALNATLPVQLKHLQKNKQKKTVTSDIRMSWKYSKTTRSALQLHWNDQQNTTQFTIIYKTIVDTIIIWKKIEKTKIINKIK